MELLSTSDLWESSSSFPFVWHHHPPPTGCCSASKSCLTLGNPVDCSTPGFPVFHCFLEFCSNSCPLRQWCCLTISSSAAPFSSAFSLSQHLCLFLLSRPFTSGGQSVGVSNEFRLGFPLGLLVWSPYSLRDSQEPSPAPQFESIHSLVLCLLYGPTLTSIHDYWKNHSFDYTDLCCQSGNFAF